MPLTRDEALHVLELSDAQAPGEVEQAVAERRQQIEQRLASAPTEALRAKYRRQLDELDDARQSLLGGPALPTGSDLSQTMLADLPLAQASYTRVEGGPAAGAPGVALKPGQTLGGGRYEILEQIGAGGMGAVYRAFDKNRDKDIAIKVLLPAMFARPKAHERFLAEARLSSEMSHPNIVTVFDVQQDGPHTFLTMELLRGQTLRVYLNTLKGLRKTMPVDEALRITEQVCHGLAYSHDKTAVHRDIKPENIWLNEDGKVKVMDFGIARLISTSQMTQTQMALGTAYYMAPEQLQGLADIDGRADQYAVAVMLYEMLTGQIPTGRIESLTQVVKAVPRAVSLAVDRALSPRREQRYGDMEVFRLALRGKGAYRLSPNALRSLVLGGGALALIAAVAGSYPLWQGLLPDREQQASLQQQIARLEGEAKSLAELVDERRREVDTALQNAQREVERLEGQLNTVHGDAERGALELALAEARGDAAAAVFIDQGMNAALEGPEGLVSQDGKMRAAEIALKAGDLEQARDLFVAAHRGYKALKDRPEELSRQLKGERAKLVAPLNGKWTLKDCAGAGTWAVKDPTVSVYWPKQGVGEERIIEASTSGLIVSVVNPAKYRGRVYRYTPGEQSLEVTEVRTGRREILKRCP
ncbi:protein kinase domain-containing protein [Methylolobus aquaticus]